MAFEAPFLSRVEYLILVNKSGSDTAQVPSSGARVQVHRGGVTTRSATGSPIGSGSSGDIQISNPHDLLVGDVLKNGTAASPTATVNSITREANLNWKINVTAGGGSFTWAANDRLVNTSRRPTLYKDDGAKIGWGTNYVDSDANGIIYFHTDSCKTVDLLLDSGTGTPAVTAQVIRDVSCGDRGRVLNVRDFGGSIKSAIAYLNAATDRTNSTIYVPAGSYVYDTADLDIDIPSNVRIVGDGPSVTNIFVEATAGNENKDLFRLRGSYSGISGMTIIGRGAAASGTGRGVVVGYSDSSTTLAQVNVSDMNIFAWSSYGLEIGRRSDNSLWGVDFCEVSRCVIGGSESGAQVRIGHGSTMVAFRNCRFANAAQGNTSPTGVYMVHLGNSSNVVFDNCDGNSVDLNTYAFFAEPANSYAEPLDAGSNLTIIGCDFEFTSAPTTETTPLVYIQGWNNAVILNTLFYQMGSGVHFEDCYSPKLINCTFKALGGSGFHVKITDTINFADIGSSVELSDAETTDGRREPIVLTTAGANPGHSILGNGFKVPTYASDSERDTAPGAGLDDKRARTTDGTMIYVTTATAPTQRLQVRAGGAWVGIAGT